MHIPFKVLCLRKTIDVKVWNVIVDGVLMTDPEEYVNESAVVELRQKSTKRRPEWSDVEEVQVGDVVRLRGREMVVSDDMHCRPDVPVLVDREDGQRYCTVHGNIR